MQYVDQGYAGINCGMTYGITKSNHAGIFQNKYHVKLAYISIIYWKQITNISLAGCITIL